MHAGNRFIQVILSLAAFFANLLRGHLDKPCRPSLPCVLIRESQAGDTWQEITEGSAPYRPVSNSWKRKDTTLHVMMSSYRDPLCPTTLYNIFSKAAYPARITVGIVQQNNESDIDCIEGYCSLAKNDQHLVSTSGEGCPFHDNIRITRLPAALSRGPVWARSFSSKMIENEEFCMQIDSHMDFAIAYDVDMLYMWGAAANEYGVLSTYPPDISTIKDNQPGGMGSKSKVSTLSIHSYTLVNIS